MAQSDVTLQVETVRAWFDQQLTRLIRGTVAGSAIVIVGCGGIDTDVFDPLACAQNNGPALFDALPNNTDYIAAFSESGFGGPSTLLAELGVACATAADKETCMSMLSPGQDSNGFMLVTASGDEVRTFDRDHIMDAIGKPNSVEDATLLVRAQGFRIACDSAGRGGAREVGDGWEILCTKMTSDCMPIETTQFVMKVNREGAVTELESDVIESTSGCVGRRPPGLRSGRQSGSIGATLASHAHLEAASVPAFLRLAGELRYHGAPKQLIEACRSAAAEETTHARIVAGLAQRRGFRAAPVQVRREPTRSLSAVAMDNAVEGCVREAWGALVGLHQAQRADARDVRNAMAEVAVDEVGHAALSFAIHNWAMSRLPQSERVAIGRVQRAAVAQVRSEARHTSPIEAELGIPSLD